MIMKLIDKDAVVAEVEKIREHVIRLRYAVDANCIVTIRNACECLESSIDLFVNSIDTLKVKETDLNNDNQLTWEDIRELYIIFAEVDTEIEFCKTDIKAETIGYYQEVLKRFKARKGE